MVSLMLVKPEAFRKFVQENEEFFKKIEDVLVKAHHYVADEDFTKWVYSEEGMNFLDKIQEMLEMCHCPKNAVCLKTSNKFKADVAFKLLMGDVPVSYKRSNAKNVIVRVDEHIYVINRATGETDAYSVSDFVAEAIPGYHEDIILEYRSLAQNSGYRVAYCLLKLSSILSDCLNKNHKNYEGTVLLTFDSFKLLSTMRTLSLLKRSLC